MAELTTTLEGKRPKGRTAAAAHSAEATEKVRVSLDISPELNEKLQAMARDINGTKSEVLRKSLALLDVALEATRNGQKIGIADRSDQLTREIIGFRH